MKKKVSGQTIAIIILVVLLLLTLTFGGVYAYYSSTTGKISGKIVLANLNIGLTGNPASSVSSEMLIANSNPVVPGERLENTPLVVINNSNTPIYLAIAYKINIYNPDTMLPVEINANQSILSVYDNDMSLDWSNYTYTYVNSSSQTVSINFFITRAPQSPSQNNITVIGENKLRMPSSWGNVYQNKIVSLSFQAYAIGSNSLTFSGEETTAERNQKIMDAICEAFDYNLSM